MRQIIFLCALLGLNVYFSEACNPDQWTPRERQLYHCMRGAGWTNEQLRQWYDRLLNPQTRCGRVTVYELQEVSGCLSCQDFMQYGVIPDGCVTMPIMPTPTVTLSPQHPQPPSGPPGGGSSGPGNSGSFYPGGFGNGPNQLPNSQKPPGSG